jgi:RNA polymerase sigma-70 factor (ECF subfamily)
MQMMMFKDNLTEPAIKMPADEDAPLVAASRGGDAAAFEQLVSRYDRKLFRIAYHIVHNADDARDVVQDTFIKVFQNISRFQCQAKFSTWLYRIVVNQSLMEVRTRRRKPTPAELSLNDDEQEDRLPIDLSDWRPNPEAQYTESELRELLTRLLQELRPALRVVFVMHDLEGQTLQETAEALALTLSAVKTRSLRARLYLRERLNAHFRRDVGLKAHQTLIQEDGAGERPSLAAVRLAAFA